MKSNPTIYLTLLLGLINFQFILAQCPSCTINLPAGIPQDTILVDTVPDAYKGVYYEETMSYRLPYTTDPLAAVAPPGTNVPQGLNVDYFKILSVSGLPPGLSWVGDRPAPMTYDEVSPATRDGCITLCGIPGAAGTFVVNVNLEIQVSGFIFPSPPIPLEFVVLPDTNATFSLNAASGCAPFPVLVNNLIPSNGNPDFIYFWDFGNGTTSSLENPDTVFYDFGIQSDTTVAITQQVLIDTFPHVLESIIATATNGACNDDIPFISTNAPDMYVILNGGGLNINMDPNFQLIGNTENDSYGPDDLNFQGPIQLQDATTYTLQIWDDDSAVIFNADDQCGGDINFTTALGPGLHTLSSGGLTVQLTISKYVDTVNYVDSVTVEYCSVPVQLIGNSDENLKVYPNPNNGTFSILLELPSAVKQMKINISDLSGKMIFSERLQHQDAIFNHNIDLMEFSSGIYFLNIYADDRIFNRKIIIH